MCYGSVNKNLATLIYLADRYKNQEMWDKEVEKGPCILREFLTNLTLCVPKTYIYILAVPRAQPLYTHSNNQ